MLFPTVCFLLSASVSIYSVNAELLVAQDGSHNIQQKPLQAIKIPCCDPGCPIGTCSSILSTVQEANNNSQIPSSCVSVDCNTVGTDSFCCPTFQTPQAPNGTQPPVPVDCSQIDCTNSTVAEDNPFCCHPHVLPQPPTFPGVCTTECCGKSRCPASCKFFCSSLRPLPPLAAENVPTDESCVNLDCDDPTVAENNPFCCPTFQPPQAPNPPQPSVPVDCSQVDCTNATMAAENPFCCHGRVQPQPTPSVCTKECCGTSTCPQSCMFFCSFLARLHPPVAAENVPTDELCVNVECGDPTVAMNNPFCCTFDKQAAPPSASPNNAIPCCGPKCSPASCLASLKDTLAALHADVSHSLKSHEAMEDIAQTTTTRSSVATGGDPNYITFIALSTDLTPVTIWAAVDLTTTENSMSRIVAATLYDTASEPETDVVDLDIIAGSHMSKFSKVEFNLFDSRPGQPQVVLGVRFLREAFALTLHETYLGDPLAGIPVLVQRP